MNCVQGEIPHARFPQNQQTQSTYYINWIQQTVINTLTNHLLSKHEAQTIKDFITKGLNTGHPTCLYARPKATLRKRLLRRPKSLTNLPADMSHLPGLKVNRLPFRSSFMKQQLFCLLAFFFFSFFFSALIFPVFPSPDGAFVSKKRKPVSCHSMVFTDIEGRCYELCALQLKAAIWLF